MVNIFVSLLCVILHVAQRVTQGKGKGTVHPTTGHEGPEGE